MSGYATPTATGGRPMSEIQAEKFDRDRQDEEGRHRHVALDRLGFVSVSIRDGNGAVVDSTYEPRRPEQVAGMPVGLVDQARAAVRQYDQLVRALAAKNAELSRWCADNWVEGAARESKIDLDNAEYRTARRKFKPLMERALQSLGEVIEQVDKHRATLNDIPARQRRLEADIAAAQAKIETDMLVAQAALAQLGLT